MKDQNSAAKWSQEQVEELCRRIRRGWHLDSPGNLLFHEILRRFERGQTDISPADAAKVMGKNEAKSAMEIAARLRKDVRRLSNRDFPGLGIDIAERRYALEVKGAPPPEWISIKRSVGLLVANAADWFVGELIVGVLEICDEAQYDLIVDVSNDKREIEYNRLMRLAEKAAGILVVPVNDWITPAANRLLHSKPSVLVDRFISGVTDIPCVHHNDYAAGQRAGDYLKQRKCTRVIVIKQKSDLRDEQILTPLRDREIGCMAQLSDDSTPKSPKTSLDSRTAPKDPPIEVVAWRAFGSEEKGGFEALERFDSEYHLHDGDGIFATTDKLALGCMKYLQVRKENIRSKIVSETDSKSAVEKSKGMKLPIVSFEGQSFGGYIHPRLPSIFGDTTEMGRLAAKVLLGEMGAEGFSIRQTSCPPHFLVDPKFLRPIPGTLGRQTEEFVKDYPASITYYKGSA